MYLKVSQDLNIRKVNKENVSYEINSRRSLDNEYYVIEKTKPQAIL